MTATDIHAVTERALIRRVNRRLGNQHQNQWQMLKKARKKDACLGQYYLLDLHTNTIICSDVDLEAFARRHHALLPMEKMVKE